MCIFTGTRGSVEAVASTAIFARDCGDGEQALVYEMRVALRTPVAMVLPLPTPDGCADDAVRFVNVSGYASFFLDLAQSFLLPDDLSLPATLGPARPQQSTLEVHEVGDFEASFVPSPADFARLDPRFRLSASVWRALPAEYQDWGFAVVQLRASLVGANWWERLLRRPSRVRTRVIHPIALLFPRRNPNALFFPTVHVHDGAWQSEAMFDHSLYAQLPPGVREERGWMRSNVVIGETMTSPQAVGLIAPDRHAIRRQLRGRLPNEDTWLATT